MSTILHSSRRPAHGRAHPPGEVYAAGTVDPEGLTLTEDDTFVVTSAGVPEAGIAPWIREYTLDGGYLRDLDVPERFDPGADNGVRTNSASSPRPSHRTVSNRSLLLVADNNVTPGEASQFLLLSASPGR